MAERNIKTLVELVLPMFNDDKDDLDAYIQRFERYAISVGWDKETWQ